MKKKYRYIIVLILLQVSFSLHASVPPGEFYWSDFLGIELPFSSAEFQIIKANKIKTIEENNIDWNTKTISNIDTLGHLTKQELIEIKKKKEKVVIDISYKYNNNGHLISRLLKNFEGVCKDSLAYDTIGRIIYCSHNVIYNKKFKDIAPDHYVFKLYKSTKNLVILIDSITSKTWTINNENECISAPAFGLDTLIYIKTNDTSFIKKYMYKYDNKYFLGKESNYTNGQIQSEIVYRLDTNIINHVIKYIYSKDNSLVYYNTCYWWGDYSKYYEYNDWGLKTIELNRNNNYSIDITTYKYLK